MKNPKVKKHLYLEKLKSFFLNYNISLKYDNKYVYLTAGNYTLYYFRDNFINFPPNELLAAFNEDLDRDKKRRKKLKRLLYR